MKAYKRIIPIVADDTHIVGFISPNWPAFWLDLDRTNTASLVAYPTGWWHHKYTGIHAMKEPGAIELENYPGVKVELWLSGKVFEHELGYRAGRARVLDVLCDTPWELGPFASNPREVIPLIPKTWGVYKPRVALRVQENISYACQKWIGHCESV